MIVKRHVLAALAAGLAAGSEDRAREVIKTIDPILRHRARRRLELALIDAGIATIGIAPPMNHEDENERNLLKIAFLDVAGTRGVDPLDRDAVDAAYRALPTPVPTTTPLATIAFVIASLALVAALVGWAVMRPGPASRHYTRSHGSPAAGAFKDGGTPLGDPAIEALLVGPFTDYVLLVDVDRRSFGKKTVERERAAFELMQAPAMARSPALAVAWSRLVQLFARWVSLPVSSPEFTAVARELRVDARAVSDELGALGLGYYVEGDVFGTSTAAHAVVYSYRVDAVAILRADNKPRRVLELRRLDAINLSHALLGMESRDLGDPIVLLDQVDRHVAQYVLPVLAPTARFPLADARWPDATKFAVTAGDAVRRELAAALGPDAAAGAAIGALLVERGALIDRWRSSLDARGMRLAIVRDLFLPPAMLAQLAEVIPADERERAHDIDDEIARLEGPRIAARVQELVVHTVRRHEAQHGVDEERTLRYPAALAEHVDEMAAETGQPRSAADHANLELSAYVSQIANDPITPQLAVWDLAQHAFNADGWGSVESYVALVVLDGLVRQLAPVPHDPLLYDHAIDRDRLARITSTLPQRSGDDLRAAARSLYLELYGTKVTPITER